MPDSATFLTFVAALLAIMNPLGAVPVFIAWTKGQSVQKRRRTALVSALTVAITLLVAGVLGEQLLAFFGIRIPSFRVAGGLIVLMLAFSMLRVQRDRMTHTRGEAAEAEAKDDVAIFPLAIPFLAGPGSITTVILHSQQMHGLLGLVALLAGIVGITGLLWLALRFAVPTAAHLGQTGTNVVTRLMGMLLAAIAIEMMAGGLGELFPMLEAPVR